MQGMQGLTQHSTQCQESGWMVHTIHCIESSYGPEKGMDNAYCISVVAFRKRWYTVQVSGIISFWCTRYKCQIL